MLLRDNIDWVGYVDWTRPRFPRLRHRARHDLQRLPGPRREDRPDRRRQGPLRRANCCGTSRPSVDPAQGRLRGLQPCRAGPRGALPQVLAALPQGHAGLRQEAARPRWRSTTTRRAGRSASWPPARRFRSAGERCSSSKRRWCTGPSRCSPTCPRRSCCSRWTPSASTTPRASGSTTKLPLDTVLDEAKTYYANIVMPYGKAVAAVPGASRRAGRST